MKEFNLKKLVTGFLVLAFLATSLSLIFSSSAPTDIASFENNDVAKQTIPSNALTETLPTNEATGERSAFLATAGNLTQNLSATLADQIIAANPSGPLAINGTIGADAPTEEDLAAAVNRMINDPKTIAQVLSSLPEKKVISIKPRILHSSAPKDVLVYMESFNKIMDADTSVGDSIDGSQKGNTPMDAINALEVMFQQRIINLEKLAVPEPLVDFHRASLVLSTSAHDLVQDALGSEETSDDPLKRILIIQARSTDVDVAAQAYETEAMKAQDLLKKISLAPTQNISSLNDLFGVKIAHADFITSTIGASVGGAAVCYLSFKFGGKIAKVLGAIDSPSSLVGVPVQGAAIASVTGASSVLSFKDCLLKIAVDTLKNVLIHKLVQQTIQWIQGGYKGAPQFVTDWKGFLADAGNKVAGSAIDAIAPGLCRSWAPLIRIQLESAFLGDNPVTCTLDQVVANAKSFYNDFSQGGWVGYGAAILPSGNYFGQLFEGSQIVALQEFSAKEAAKAKAEAGQGFLSTELCISYDMVSAQDTCQKKAKEACEASNASLAAGSLPRSCAGEVALVCSGASPIKQKVCRPGGNLITTPGSAVGQVVNNALGAPIHRIVNADDISALINALVGSGLDALTKLVKGGKDDGKPNETGLLGIRLSTSTQAGLDKCSALKGDAQLKCLQTFTIGEAPAIETHGSCPEFSTAVCHASSCAGRNDGNLSYDLRMGNVNWDTANKLLFSGDTAPGGDLSRGNWYTIPGDQDGWCDPNASQFKTGAPSNPPKFDMTRRCIDGSNGGLDFSAYPTCGQGSGTSGGGSDDCGDKVHCACNTKANPNAALLKYSGAVKAAQDEVAKNPSSSGLDPANTSRITSYDTYHKAVVCELRSKGYLADHDGEEVNVSRSGDTFQENMDISSSPTNGSLTILIENAVCSSKNGDNAYPSFTSAPKVTCP